MDQVLHGAARPDLMVAAVPPGDLQGLLAGAAGLLAERTHLLLSIDYDAQAVVFEPSTAAALVALRRRFRRSLYLHIGSHSRGELSPGDSLWASPPPVHVLAGPPGGGLDRGIGTRTPQEEGVNAIRRLGGSGTTNDGGFLMALPDVDLAELSVNPAAIPQGPYSARF